MWESGKVKSLFLVVILSSVIYIFHDVKHESSWGDYCCMIKVPNDVITDDTTYWSTDTLNDERWISVRKYSGIIEVSFDYFRDDATIYLANPTKYEVENFWLYDLALGIFPCNSGERWEISLEKEDNNYFIVCRRLLITQTYVGVIFSFAFCFGFFVCRLWNILPRGGKKRD